MLAPFFLAKTSIHNIVLSFHAFAEEDEEEEERHANAYASINKNGTFGNHSRVGSAARSFKVGGAAEVLGCR